MATMEDYVVSARKYRPSAFEDVVGQEHITSTLTNAIQRNTLAQAMLFCGPRGVGKTTCARIVARLVNGYENQPKLNALTTFELDAASNNSVDDIRALTDQVRYPPQSGRYKVYIIDEVHMLSNAAFNAFLKTLEEPPPYAIFIMATTEKNKVIPTVLSRCQLFEFNRIQLEDMISHLKKIAGREKIHTEEKALELIAQKADGSLRDALSSFDMIVAFSSTNEITLQNARYHLCTLDSDYYFKTVEELITKNTAHLLLLFNEILKKGFDGRHFIVGLGNHLRNLLVSQDMQMDMLMSMSEDYKKRCKEQAKGLSPSLLLSWLDKVSQCDLNYKNSANQRLLVELALMKMAQLNPKSTQKVHQEQSHKKEEKKEEEKKNDNEPSSLSNNPSLQIAMLSKNSPSEHINRVQEVASNIEAGVKKIPRLPNLTRQHTPKEDTLSPTLQKIENKSSTLEDITSVWNTFADQHATHIGVAHILNRSFHVHNHCITVTLLNSVEEPILQRIKNELVSYLQNKLHNSRITIDSVMQDSSIEQKTMYTSTEKFNSLSSTNATINELKARFNLTCDY